MTNKITIKDLAEIRSMDDKELSTIRGGVVSERFLFSTGASSATPTVLSQFYNLGTIEFNQYDVAIDNLVQQTNNLTQVNIVDVLALGGSTVDVAVDQGQFALNDIA